MNGDHVLRVIRQVLIQVGQRVGVRTELFIKDAQSVASAISAEPLQIHHVQGGDVVRPAPEVLGPVALRFEHSGGFGKET